MRDWSLCDFAAGYESARPSNIVIYYLRKRIAIYRGFANSYHKEALGEW